MTTYPLPPAPVACPPPPAPLPPAPEDEIYVPNLHPELPDTCVIPEPISDLRTIPDHWRTRLSTPPPPTDVPGRTKFKAPAPQDTDTEELESNSPEPDSEVDDTQRDLSSTPSTPEPLSPSLKVIARRGGSGETGKVQLISGKWLTNYEYMAEQKKYENKKLMEKFDIPTAARAVIGQPKAKSPSHRRVRPQPRTQPSRASKSQIGSL